MGFLNGTPAKPQTGTPTIKKSTEKHLDNYPQLSRLKDEFDVKQLCKAIAEHETHNCRDKTNSTAVNNCHGFRVNGKFLPFKTKADSYAYCENLWPRAYSGGLPTEKDASKWSGRDRAISWRKNVTFFYHNL